MRLLLCVILTLLIIEEFVRHVTVQHEGVVPAVRPPVPGHLLSGGLDWRWRRVLLSRLPRQDELAHSSSGKSEDKFMWGVGWGWYEATTKSSKVTRSSVLLGQWRLPGGVLLRRGGGTAGPDHLRRRPVLAGTLRHRTGRSVGQSVLYSLADGIRCKEEHL